MSVNLLEKYGRDIDREKWTTQKALAIFKLALFRLFGRKEVAAFENVLAFDDELKKHLAGEENLLPLFDDKTPAVVSFDFDKTLAVKDGKDVHDLFLPMIKRLVVAKFCVLIVSNKVYDEHTRHRYDRLTDAGCFLVTHMPAKPAREAFDILLARANEATAREVRGKDVLHVGDNFFTDGGAILCGMRFVKVSDVTQERLAKWSQ